jgi:hypothetical protein
VEHPPPGPPPGGSGKARHQVVHAAEARAERSSIGTLTRRVRRAAAREDPRGKGPRQKRTHRVGRERRAPARERERRSLILGKGRSARGVGLLQ